LRWTCSNSSLVPVIAVTEFAGFWPKIERMTEVRELDAGALFASCHQRIYRYVLRLVRNPAEAEDLTQETFLRACRAQESLRDPEAVRGWLYRIATHVCVDRVRQRQPQVSLDGEPESVARATAATPSGLEIVERRETSRCVQRCLEFLSDNDRAVLLLYEAHSLTAPEIAGLLGLNLATVKMRLHRARARLQRVMECGCAISKDERGLPVCQPKRQ
jgi:RNA polymerase sigma-70 factor (ECF subfamily)